jgi:hypothetical protein
VRGGCHPIGPRHPEPAEGRQLQRRPGRVDPKTEAEQVHLETLTSGQEDADQAVKRYLKSRPARCRGDDAAARQEFHADSIRRELDRQIGDLPGDVREEGIAVGSGPRTVAIGIRVARDSIAHLPDHPIDTRAAAVEQDLRPGPEPVIVRPHPVDPQRRRAVGDTEPQDLVAGEAGCSDRQAAAGVVNT